MIFSKWSTGTISIAFDLNSNPNNFLEVLLIGVFFVDCLMCLNISLISLKISKYSLSGSILINLQSSYCFISLVFLLLNQYFSPCIHFHQFLLRAYSHESISQSYNLIIFSPSNKLIILASTSCSFVKKL